MAAELALRADPAAVEQAFDPAGFVMRACERAKALLTEALERGEIEQIAELMSQARAVEVYTAQKKLGKDAELAAAEVVRRAERGLALAVRRGQENGRVKKRGDGGWGARNLGGNGDTTKASPEEFVGRGGTRAGTYALADGVPDDDFEGALGEAKTEGNLSRANVVRKIRRRRGAASSASGAAVPDPADRSAEAAGRRRDLIAEMAGRGMTSRQIGARLGIAGQRVRQVARGHGIAIGADALVGRTRRLDSNRIVRDTVDALEGMVLAIELADATGLDPAEAPGWAASMTRSLRVLSTFVRQMKETT
jgi:hypothetical protein